MAKGKPLSEFERGRIFELNRGGLSHRSIANEVNRSKTVITNFLRNPDQYGHKKSPGRQKKNNPITGSPYQKKFKKKLQYELKSIEKPNSSRM